MKQAIDQATDFEMRDLSAQLTRRQDQVAQLQGELIETRTELELFERQLEDELGNLKHTLSVLRRKLQKARRHSQWQAQWGDRADSEDIPEDVLEQFEKTWRPRGAPSQAEEKVSLDEDAKTELKAIFRELAKKFHPDLVMDPEVKQRRESIMSQVNQAYAANDLRALKRILEKPDVVKGEPERTRDEKIVHMRKEILRLDEVISELKQELSDLVNSATVKLMLDVSMARKAGRNLLAEMAENYRAEISQIEAELSRLR